MKRVLEPYTTAFGMVINRNNIVGIIREKHEDIVSGLIKGLEGRPLALSMDCGVRKERKILSLNCHVITNNEYQTIHLGMIEMKEICTGEYIVTKIEVLLTEYKVRKKSYFHYL